ncbi:hypothetical protein L3Q65_00235 (plasmid) [Amycolatopsis sp. FU40]|uniref:hypothetical protein n=1 Tax=Amycolatopsis sp. FU40 TaxID=2914159 RepID=UPI001F2024E0|nr:hypothetical protein [Amycolatopsis sp. FU40]UKD50727.1 hypothetical protein L3Q65_00235 [Amycolatopsis sp. FU40]
MFRSRRRQGYYVPPPPRRGLGRWVLPLVVLALAFVAGLLFGWNLPASALVAVVLAVMALAVRPPAEPRGRRRSRW